MSEECRQFCEEPAPFPRPIHNRPGLSRIAYRIGTHAEFLAELLRRLDRDDVLAGWTHREPDDPGIALLDGAAVLGDVLTFYQELYANEAYLRTARWRESVSDLVRLIGYRLAPGAGGRATFVLEVKGEAPVVVPAEFGLKAELEGADEPADFATGAEAVAVPALSRFHLYRRRNETRPVSSGATALEIASIGGAADAETLAAFELRQGDRLMLVPDATMFDVTGTAYTTQQPAEIVVVRELERVLDRVVIHLEGALATDRGATVRAYRLGRSFRHFGHNAPPKVNSFSQTTSGGVTTTTVTQTNTGFQRDIYDDHGTSDATLYSAIALRDMPLDQEVNDLSTGAKLICQGAITFTGQSTPVEMTVVRTITRVRPDTRVWGHLNGPSTVATIDRKLVANDSILNERSDIRTLRFHEATGPELVLRAARDGSDGAFGAPQLSYFGTRAEAVLLAGRALLLEAGDGALHDAVVVTAPDDPALAGGSLADRGMWPISLYEIPGGLRREDFDERSPRVTVYGNLVEATQGKHEREVTLGNGDARQKWQSFRLPKAPLTYLPAPGETPPFAAELEVYVEGRLWTRVESFFGRGPREEVYVVREDMQGESWVQFGDGKTGRQLPSGVGNVVARYRTGIGAHGALQEGKNVQADRLDRLVKARLPGVASGGAQPEGPDTARIAAPARLQSLGRLVSLGDYEAEALSIPGVTRARAAWELVDGVPAVVVTVLMAGGREAEFADAEATLRQYERCRGPARHPLRVQQGSFLDVALTATVAYDPTFRRADVEQAIAVALGVSADEEDAGDGLFSVARRSFGEGEYATRVAGVVQDVPGVLWVRVTAFHPAREPAGPTPAPTVPGDARKILRLPADRLLLVPSSAPAQEVC